jgi:hypothetical protein
MSSPPDDNRRGAAALSPSGKGPRELRKFAEWRFVLWIMSPATALSSQSDRGLDLTPGELVRVRSASEIFATLDDRGALDGLPFMPEMLKYCGRILPVTQRAKPCAGDGAVRRMHNTVHLQSVRCDGSAHDGCQAACLMFWKEAWLERVENRSVRNGIAPRPRRLSEEEQAYVDGTLHPATRETTEAGDLRYRCQATDIRSASEPLRFRHPDQYVSDLQNWPLRKIARGVIIDLFNHWQRFSERHLPERLRISGGREYPFVVGRLNKGETPSGKLDLRIGDLVRIKTKEQIVATLDKTNRNRGLSFDGEMSNYCGRTARVRARVNRLIEESTGEMIDIKSDCIILDGVVCAADYHRFCTRAIYPYWREIWLEKIDSSQHENGSAAPFAGCRGGAGRKSSGEQLMHKSGCVPWTRPADERHEGVARPDDVRAFTDCFWGASLG